MNTVAIEILRFECLRKFDDCVRVGKLVKLQGFTDIAKNVALGARMVTND